MIFDITILTFVRVVLSLVGILFGFVVVGGFLTAKRRDGWTALFLASTILTSVTGFLFPFRRFLPSHALFHLAGPWRRTYVIAVVMPLYLNVFVLIAQFFMNIPGLKALAPTSSEPPFLGTQVVVMLIFIVLGVLAAKRFSAEAVHAV
jgi:hypothetical protein